MAQAKVSQDALVKMAETLRQSAEEIMSAKTEMDSQLRSFVWDDPTGYYFTGKYEDDFKPLTEKLIPAIEEYVSYIAGLEGSVAEYSEVATALGAGTLGFAAAGSFAGAQSERKGIRQIIKKSSANEERRKAKGILPFLYESENGNITWNNERFSQLEKENAQYLAEEGKEHYKNALEAFNIVFEHNPTLNSVTYNQLSSLVDLSVGLKGNQMSYEKKPFKEYMPGWRTFAWHPRNSNRAILNKSEEAYMPQCEKLAKYAHEARHFYQEGVINGTYTPLSETYLKKLKEDSLKEPIMPKRTNFDDSKEGGKRYEESMSIYYENYKKWYSESFAEEDARKFEFVVGKACVDFYNSKNNSITK